jgi:hypothetical protein
MPKRRQTVKRSQNPETAEVLARQGLRYRILRLIYELGEGAVDRPVSSRHLQQREEVAFQALEQILSYLRDEKLINAQYGFSSVSLRHKGLVEIERAILNPTDGTEHFDAKVTASFSKTLSGVGRTMRITPGDES